MSRLSRIVVGARRGAFPAVSTLLFLVATLAHDLGRADAADHHAEPLAKQSQHDVAQPDCAGAAFEACHAIAYIRPSQPQCSAAWTLAACLRPDVPTLDTGLRPTPEEPVPIPL